MAAMNETYWSKVAELGGVEIFISGLIGSALLVGCFWLLVKIFGVLK